MLASLWKGLILTALASAAAGAQAATFVYISNAEDGDISGFRMHLCPEE